MKTFLFIFLVIATLLIASCTTKNVEFPIPFEIETISIKDDQCHNQPDECCRIDISFPVFSEPQGEKANLLIRQYICFITGSSFDETILSPQEAADNFIKKYQEFKAEFLESSQIWSIDLKSRASFYNADILCIEFIVSAYMGGAHSNSERVYITFDSKGNKVKILDHISDVNKLKSIAEKKFRKMNNIGEKESLNKGGYFFPNGQFIFSKSIGITEHGMVLFYNPYEIAPYYKGPTEILIDFSDLEEITKKPLF